ncbi:copper homeostasis periplasmic binding protein CopC [Erwiniaceae bacterium BAC15a-03b]|uniref:Copper resistance protein C n=1 Tax=Winslowiella arboricola TaxID=2978220 RepID=A0A9J6PZC5_9GAMM|nr:copper homeostasis periplasmic binding protein CopC [Winslowiella arboricola]MCU5775327.1 copper homeostasis periplasmic binding protein CopC [Winslowiella arboricola]MCU5780276.1 copper homeostasis periplasmic binding protein CopC [Winslowiella arboricola]
MLNRIKQLIAATSMVSAMLISPAVLAHAHLTTATPADKAQLSASPAELTLKFTEGIEPAFSGVKVLNASGKAVASGKAAVDSSDGTLLHIPLNDQLPSGAYKVNWHVLSTDGHKTKGSYSFSIK